jgi:ubiquinone/menaquinone biosynthesis C-methylase UbiE
MFPRAQLSAAFQLKLLAAKLNDLNNRVHKIVMRNENSPGGSKFSRLQNRPTRHSFPEDIFQARLRQLARPGQTILDAGCGSARLFVSPFQNIAVTIVGIDISRDALKRNSQLDFAVSANAVSLPFSDSTFDLINCRWTIEHLSDPSSALKEFHRVLNPGGTLAVFTSNLFHYYGIASRLTPHWFHRWFNCRVRGFEENDIFPAYYRANSMRTLRTLLCDAGFINSEIQALEGPPTVLAFSKTLHRLGLAYENIVRRFAVLEPFRLNLMAIAQKSCSDKDQRTDANVRLPALAS